MKRVKLHIAVQTTRWLGGRQTVERFRDLLGEMPDVFTPDKVGFSDPIREKFVLGNAVEQLKWLYLHPRGESVDFKYTDRLRGRMHFNAQKGWNAWYNGFKVVWEYSSVTKHATLSMVHACIEKVLRFCEAAYACATLAGGSPHVSYTDDPKKNWGDLDGIPVPPWNPMGIKHVPGICWVNVFGPEYIAYFGEETLTRLRGYRCEFIDDRRWFWLQPTERPEEMLTPAGKALAERIKQELGKPEAFYGHDPSVPSYKARYDTPAFDYSELREPRPGQS